VYTSGDVTSLTGIIVSFVYTGVALGGTDYTGVVVSVTIPAGQTGVSFTLTALQDLIFEWNEDLFVSIVSVVNGLEVLEQEVSVSIIDDETIPEILLSLDTGSIAEASGAAVFTVYTSGDVTSLTGIIVSFVYTGVALGGTDYTGVVVSVTIPAGQTGVSFTLTALQDLIFEWNEDLFVSIVSVVNGLEVLEQEVSVSIIDDETIPEILLSLDTGSIAEASGSAVFTVYTSGDVTSLTGIIVSFVYTGVALGGTDYTGVVVSVTIPAGQTGVSFTLTALQDLIFEWNEDLFVSIVSVVNGLEVLEQEVSVSIIDDETIPEILLSLDTGSIAEASGAAVFTVYTSGDVTSLTGIIVSFVYTGVALGGTDYTGVVVSVTIPAGQTGVSFTLTALQDLIFEWNETLVVDISSVTNGNEAGNQTQTVTIVDDEACGNGAIAWAEQCDDGNIVNGDGCNATCQLESGATCTVDVLPVIGVCDTAGTGSVSGNVCGNGLVAWAEICDDSNTVNGDGCSATCTLETGATCAVDVLPVIGVCDNGGTGSVIPDTTPPIVPTCTATPNPATGGTLVTVTCTAIASGDSISISGAICTPDPSTGWDVTCTALGSIIGTNPTVTVTDPAGNPTTGTVPLVIDNTPPAAPTVTSVDGQTGNIVTSDTTPTFVGTGEPGSTITITDGSGNVIGTGIVDGSGNWTVTPSTPLPEWTSVLTVTATDPAGNVSPGTPVTVIVDTITPVAPTVTSVDGQTGNIVTSDTTPTFVGTGEPGSTITITDGSGNVIGTGIVDGSGNWTVTPSTPLPEWTSVLTVTATDPAGNVSPGTPVTVMVDTITPVAPTVTSVDGQTGNIVTSDTTPTFVGTGEPGSTITITDGSGNVIGTGIVDGSGNWTVTPSTPLPEWTSVLTVTATDPAGNVSPGTPVTVMVDTITPVAPTVTSVDGQTGNIVTSDTTPTFVGTGEPGSTITITDGSGNVIGTGIVDGSGNWTVTPSTPLPEWTSVLTVTATDPAGNVSPGTPVTVIVDTNVVVNLTGVYTIPESWWVAQLRVYLSGNITVAQDITLSLAIVTGTASNGIDFAGTLTITILAWTTGTTFSIAGLQDSLYEGSEYTQIIITSASGNNSIVGSINFGQVTIIDDDTLNIYIYDPTNCSGHIRGGIIDPTNTLIVRVRIYSGATLIQQYVPPLTITGAFFINPNYTNSGGTGYIAPGTYQVIYDGETTGGVEIVGGSYVSFLGQSCPTSNGWWFNTTPAPLPITTGSNIIEEETIDTNTSSDTSSDTPPKRMVKLLTMPHIPSIKDIIDGVEDILSNINALPITWVEIVKGILESISEVDSIIIHPMVLPKTGVDQE
jgi:cysteine-rich repeat protein